MLVLGGCGGQKPSEQTSLDAASAAILARADAQDGQADKIVGNCGGCRLGMPGKAEHAVKAGDYEMHFCSVECKESFSKSLVASIQGLDGAVH
jgi:hypothetical protein